MELPLLTIENWIRETHLKLAHHKKAAINFKRKRHRDGIIFNVGGKQVLSQKLLDDLDI